MARTAGHGQANDEAPRTSFFQVTFDPLVVPVALRSPSRRIGHEDTSQGQAIAGSDPASGAPPPILIGDNRALWLAVELGPSFELFDVVADAFGAIEVTVEHRHRRHLRQLL